MKVVHRPDIDYLSIDFSDEIEAKSYIKDGIIVREDKHGHVLGIDIVDSSKVFLKEKTLNLQEACKLLSISESTMRRMIKAGKVKYEKPNGKDYRFKMHDILKLVS